MGYARPPQVFFYEIHEGDEDLGAAVLVAHEERFEPLEFFALVKKARALLVASVNVDETEEGTFLVSEDAGDRSVFLSSDDDIDTTN